MPKARYTDSQVIEAVQSSRSKREVLTKLGLVPQGGSYVTLDRAITRLGLDTTHFEGQAWLKGVIIGPKRPIEDYLSGKYVIGSHDLKKRLIREGLLEEACSKCGLLNVWQDEYISLHLDHIDGENTNNQLSNLRLLCPNCHSQTSTYCGKSLKKNRGV